MSTVAGYASLAAALLALGGCPSNDPRAPVVVESTEDATGADETGSQSDSAGTTAGATVEDTQASDAGGLDDCGAGESQIECVPALYVLEGVLLPAGGLPEPSGAEWDPHSEEEQEICAAAWSGEFLPTGTPVTSAHFTCRCVIAEDPFTDGSEDYSSWVDGEECCFQWEGGYC